MRLSSVALACSICPHYICCIAGNLFLFRGPPSEFIFLEMAFAWWDSEILLTLKAGFAAHRTASDPAGSIYPALPELEKTAALLSVPFYRLPPLDFWRPLYVLQTFEFEFRMQNNNKTLEDRAGDRGACHQPELSLAIYYPCGRIEPNHAICPWSST